MQLLRAIGFFRGNILILSATIGAGIFVSPKGVLKYSHWMWLSPWVFMACAVLTLVSRSQPRRAGDHLPISGAQYYFLKKTLSLRCFSIFLDQTIYSSLKASYQSLLLSTYTSSLSTPGAQLQSFTKKVSSIGCFVVLGLLNAWGVQLWLGFKPSVLAKMTVLCFICLITVLLGCGKGKCGQVRERFGRWASWSPHRLAEAFLAQDYHAFWASSILNSMAGKSFFGYTFQGIKFCLQPWRKTISTCFFGRKWIDSALLYMQAAEFNQYSLGR